MADPVPVPQDPILRALGGIADTLAVHTDLLERIWAAANEEPPPSELPETLKTIAARLSAQEEALRRIETLLTALPGELAKALHGDRAP